jgi:hypothetical protein
MSAAPRDIRIFVSYRRADAYKPATKIYAKLARHFGGKTRVFQDVSSIIPGVDYEKAIDDAVGSCDVFLVVIGSEWLTAADEDGGLRLADETDRHRREIEAAFKREIPVLPVLVDEAVMPREEDLPGDLLKTLHRIQGQRLDTYAMDVDIEELIGVIETAATQHRTRIDQPTPTPAPVEEPEEEDEDARKREGALQHAEKGEFARALEIASSIEDPVTRADALLAVASAQVEAGTRPSETQETLVQARAATVGIADDEERDRVLEEAADVESDIAVPDALGLPPGAFAAAEAIAGPRGIVLGDNAAATKEPGEPDHAGNPGGRSIWYRWTARAAATVTIDTFGSDFDTLLAVYRGSSLADLELVAANDDADGSQSRVTFRVVEGEEYRIAVDGYGGAAGSIVLNWQVLAPPPNSSFANAVELVGSSGTIRGDSTGSSKEPDEPDHAGSAGGSSVWYRWTAPQDGVAIVDTFGSDFDTLLAVYRGSSLGLLDHVAANDDAGRPQSRVTFRVAEGDDLRIAVDGYASAAGAIVLNWSVHDRESLRMCLDGAGLRYVEAGEGAVMMRLPGTRREEVVIDATESSDGVTFISVDLPAYSGFGAKSVLQTLLKISYVADYAKVMSLAGGGFAVAAEIPSSALSRTVCEGLTWAVAALGDVAGPADLRDANGWTERIARCTTVLDRYLDVDHARARAETGSLLAGAGLASGSGYALVLGAGMLPVALHVNRRVISLMVTLEGTQPRGDRQKLERLLELNRLVDVGKVGLNSQGDVTLLYEVPEPVPELAEHAVAQLRTLFAAVRAAI